MERDVQFASRLLGKLEVRIDYGTIIGGRMKQGCGSNIGCIVFCKVTGVDHSRVQAELKLNQQKQLVWSSEDGVGVSDNCMCEEASDKGDIPVSDSMKHEEGWFRRHHWVSFFTHFVKGYKNDAFCSVVSLKGRCVDFFLSSFYSATESGIRVRLLLFQSIDVEP